MRNLKVGFIYFFFLQIEHLFMIFAKYFEISITYIKLFRFEMNAPKKKGLKKTPESVLLTQFNFFNYDS